MAGPWDLTNQNIEDTYQRILQTPDGTNFYDGTGSAVTFTATAAAGGSNTQIQFNSASLLSGSLNFSFNYTNNSVLLTGSILMSGSSYISGVDYIDFDTTASIATSIGRLHWNDVDGTLQLGLKGGVVSTEIGQGLVTRVVNKTVPNIDLLAANYQAVVVAGAQGQRLAIKLALADKDATSAGTLGLVAEDIPKNQEGFIVTVGLLKNRDTTGALQGETWNDGDVLYLSPTTAGAITNIKPQAPQHTVIIGYVEYAHQNNGKIYIKIDNGYELDELHNVRITTASLSTGDLLMYSSSLWINSKTLSGSYTLSGSLTTNDGVSVQSLTASFVSASSITGSLFGTASWASNAVKARGATYGLADTNTNFDVIFINPSNDSFNIGSPKPFQYNPNIQTLYTTASNAISSSYALNALTSSFAVSASWAPSTATTPGGSDRNIQFKSASAFQGSDDLSYIYDPNDANYQQLLHQSNFDVTTTAYPQQSPASIQIYNTANNGGQGTALMQAQYTLSNNTGATTIFIFDAGGGTTGNLNSKIQGFKCDYSLVLDDGSSTIASRIGTLMGAWSYDTNITPVLKDDFVDGDAVFNEIKTVLFTLIWNGSNIELQMDCTNVSSANTRFGGLFTIFSNKN